MEGGLFGIHISTARITTSAHPLALPVLPGLGRSRERSGRGRRSVFRWGSLWDLWPPAGWYRVGCDGNGRMLVSCQDPFAAVADRFVEHYRSLRGAVRSELVSRQLDEHLPPGRLSVVDVGGGAGQQALRLARLGHRVVLVDPSKRMLEKAATALDGQPPKLHRQIRLVRAGAEDAGRLLADNTFDVVCCHAVLPYVDDPVRVIAALAGLAHPHTVLSLVFKNADALAMRAALERRWLQARDAFDADEDVGGLGIPTRAHRLTEVAGWLRAVGLGVVTWYGIRIFTDHLHDAPLEELDAVLPVEAEAARRDPYRSLGRLIHVIAQPGTPTES